MSSRSAAILLVASLTGCASQPVHSKSPSKSALRADSHPSASISGRVTLPYTFMRHGIEVRVASVELSDGKFLVNTTVQETRGDAYDFPISNLIEMRSTSGNALPYLGYTLQGTPRTDLTVHVSAHEQFPMALLFEPPPSHVPETSFQLRFPTGKYWSSQGRE